MIIVCRLTKMAHFSPFKEEGFTSEHLATMFNFVFRLHGIPQDIVSDRGPIFTSKFWRAFCTGLGIKLNFSTAYHPQSDGQTERVNQVLEQYLRMFVNYQQNDWSQMLYKAEFTYNNSEHTSTKMTPFYANYGYHPLDPCTPVIPTGNPSARTRLEHLVTVRATLAENIERAQEDYAKHYNRKVKSHLTLADQPLCKVGDKAWLSSKDVSTSRPSAKLDHRFLGPFKIIQKVSDVTYRLDLPPTMDINNSFHVSRLEPFKLGHPNQPQQEVPPIFVQGERRYVPERILDGTFDDASQQYMYLVHWEGYPDSEDTWEPYEELKHLSLFRRFRTQHHNDPALFPRSRNVRKKTTNSRKH